MDLSDVIDEMEEASSRADEAKALAESAVSQLKDKLEEINQLDSDWKEYLDEHVTCSAVADWLVANADDGALNYVCSASPNYRQKKLESEQVQAVYWEEVEANRLARALMEAAFLADARFARRQKIDELWLQMKQMQSEIEKLRGDA